jgi:hypothetical protein
MHILDLPPGRPSVTRTARRQATATLHARRAAEATQSAAWAERRRTMRPVTVLAVGDRMAALETERLQAIEAQWRSDLERGLQLQLEAERSLPFYQAQRRGRPRAEAAADQAPTPDLAPLPATPGSRTASAPESTERIHYFASRNGRQIF